MLMSTRTRPLPDCGNTVSSLFEPERLLKEVKSLPSLRNTRQLPIPINMYEPSWATAISATAPLMSLLGLMVITPFSMKPKPALQPNQTRSSSLGSATMASTAAKLPDPNSPGSVPSTISKFSPSADQ